MLQKFCNNLKGSFCTFPRLHNINTSRPTFVMKKALHHNQHFFMINSIQLRYFSKKESKNKRDEYKDEEEIMDQFYDAFEKPKQAEKDIDEKMTDFTDKEAIRLIFFFICICLTLFNFAFMMSRKRVQYLESNRDEKNDAQDKMIADLEEQLKEVREDKKE